MTVNQAKNNAADFTRTPFVLIETAQYDLTVKVREVLDRD